MNGATVVQAGGSAEQQFEAAVQAAVPLELAPSELPPVDVAKLRASLISVLTRADHLLSAKQAIAMESGFDMLSDLADEMGELSRNLWMAEAAHYVLSVVHKRLSCRAQAVLEVCEMPEDLHTQHFSVTYSNWVAPLLEGCELPERWQRAFADRLSGGCASPDDIPF